MISKSEQVRTLLAAKEFTKALSLASTFRLGDPATLNTVKLGHDANQNPRFYTQLKKNPDQLVTAGIEALHRLVACN